MIDFELAIAVITLALLALLACLAAFSRSISREREEIRNIAKKIDHVEESIERINGSLVARE